VAGPVAGVPHQAEGRPRGRTEPRSGAAHHRPDLRGLAQFVARRVSLVIVEQYLQRALALANRVYILSRGEVIHVGKADELDPDQIYQRYLGIES
jgi:ABC-type uncharacterized transport system ATPase subunit